MKINVTIFFTIISFFYSILLVVGYFSKKRLKSTENKIYSILIICNLIGIISELVCCAFAGISVEYNMIYVIINKLYLLYLLTWNMLFLIYIFYVSMTSTNKIINHFNSRKTVHVLKLITKIVYIVCFIAIIMLPVKFHLSDGVVMYSYGPAVDFIFFFVGSAIFLMIICTIYNYKNLRDKKYFPLYTFLFLGVITNVIQSLNPNILLATSMETFITFLMYFTIENPDVKMIEQLNIAKDQADKANMAKSEFLSNMSHEIRTPLNAIVGFSQALQEEDLPPQAQEEVKDIMMASESLLDIVNGILDISKIESGKLEIVNTEYSTKKVFDELVALTRARLGDKPLDFRVSIDPTLPSYLYGDYVRLKQVILNLLTNAVKYTKEGYIEFKVSTVKKDGICRIIASVEDSGIGIENSKIDKLFTKFERFDLEKNITIEGTGLGLAITKKLVDLMHGKIVVQSIYGKGSRFTVAIDQRIVDKKVIEQEETLDEFVPFDATGKKILVVDDNKVNLKVAARLLKDYKVEVVEVDNGYECIQRIRNNEHFDLVLLDDMMPKMSGVETLKHLKEDSSYSVPTVALTANAISGMKEKYLSDGFDDYLSKPIDKNELNRVIRKFLDKK